VLEESGSCSNACRQTPAYAAMMNCCVQRVSDVDSKAVERWIALWPWPWASDDPECRQVLSSR
jgi:hypothetical protein